MNAILGTTTRRAFAPVRFLAILTAATIVFVAATPAMTAPATTAPADEAPAKAAKYDLKYKFTAGETIRTKVAHSSSVRTTIKNANESAVSSAVSIKVWKVTDVDAQGRATFEYSIEHLSMRGKIGDQAEVGYDSAKDKVVPAVYKGVAQTVGIPLSVIVLDPKGKVLKREQKLANAPAHVSGSEVTVPLPSEPVAIGDVWDESFEIPTKLESGGTRKVKARHRFKLNSVADGVARIAAETQILDPALPPQIEVQLIQRLTNGEILFDVARGRVTSQKMAVDDSVVNFHGSGSLMKYKMEFSETLLTDNRTATVPRN